VNSDVGHDVTSPAQSYSSDFRNRRMLASSKAAEIAASAVNCRQSTPIRAHLRKVLRMIARNGASDLYWWSPGMDPGADRYPKDLIDFTT
jgi:hypothetical protein